MDTEDDRETWTEPTLRDWQELVCFVAFEKESLCNTVYFLLCSTASGRAYLDRIVHFPSETEEEELPDLNRMTDIFDARARLDQLIADPRFGVEPGRLDWEALWVPGEDGPMEDFQLMIWLSCELESRATTHAERERLRFVREALDAELILKQHQVRMARRR